MTTLKIQYNKAMNAVLASFLLFAVLFTFSCQTIKIKELEPFAAIDKGAEAYIFLPIEGNEAFLHYILAERMNRKDIKMAIARTKNLSIGIFRNSNGENQEAETLICAVGKYPANMASSIFKEKNGWTKYRAKNNVQYYSGGISAISIPNNHNALLALSNDPEKSMDKFLSNADKKKLPSFSENFERFIESNSKASFGVFIENPNLLLEKFIGMNLNLPLKNAEIYVKQEDSKNGYNYNFYIESTNEMTAFVLSTILNAKLNGIVRSSKTTTFIENGTLTDKELSEILKKIF